MPEKKGNKLTALYARFRAYVPSSFFPLLYLWLIYCFPANALVACTATMSNVNFGNVNPLSSMTQTTAALNYSCNNNDVFFTYSATVCFNIGQYNTGGIMTSSASSTLPFAAYQNASYSQIWGSQYIGNTPFSVSMTLAPGATRSGSAPLYAQIPGGQYTVLPGTYQGSFDTIITTNNSFGTTAPGTCSGTQGTKFPFTIMAQVVKQCSVSYASNVSFGSVNTSQTNILSSNTLGVACSSNTPYTIGLVPSNNNTTGSGVMKGTGSNTDTVPYQLSSTSGPAGKLWGNTAQNTMAGTGTGSTIAYTVYGTVPSANYTPDSYSDTVTINVTY